MLGNEYILAIVGSFGAVLLLITVYAFIMHHGGVRLGFRPFRIYMVKPSFVMRDFAESMLTNKYASKNPVEKERAMIENSKKICIMLSFTSLIMLIWFVATVGYEICVIGHDLYEPRA